MQPKCSLSLFIFEFPLIQCLIHMSRIQNSTISAARECFAQN